MEYRATASIHDASVAKEGRSHTGYDWADTIVPSPINKECDAPEMRRQFRKPGAKDGVR